MARAKTVPITPSVLEWAIQESGYSPSELAAHLNISEKTLDAWIRGAAQPGITQFKKLATTVKRPTATFLLPSPPTDKLPHVEFRRRPGPGRTSLNPTELRFLRDSWRIQRALSWIQRECEEPPLTLLEESTGSSPEAAAERVRIQLQVGVEQQQEWAGEYRALNGWREALEKQGILVFQLPMGKDSCRGFSMWDDYTPLIAVNTWWNPQARMFTLFHEYGHLITRTNSACLTTWGIARADEIDPVERWCERYSAAVLMPWSATERFLFHRFGWKSGQQIRDLNVVGALARRFKVSLRAATLRLIEYGQADWHLYWEIPEASEKKKGGGGGGGRKRAQIRVDQYGFRTCTLFLKSINQDVLGRNEVRDYLNVSASDLSSLEKTVTSEW